MRVRAKFTVLSVTLFGSGKSGSIKLVPAQKKWDAEKQTWLDDENAFFWRATPNGQIDLQIDLQIDNEPAFEFFRQNIGRDVYVDFTLVQGAVAVAVAA
jgi:hypothetical protein